MKKKNLMSLTAVVLLFVMIALVMICGTLAKYATEYTGDGTAIVAKWNVKIKEGGADVASDKTFNLFDESKVFDLANVGNVNDLSAETGIVDTDVATGDENGAIVAPGTWGKVGFDVVISNDTQVSVKYGIDLKSVTNANNIPLQFSTDGTTWVNNLSELNLNGTVLYSAISTSTGDITKSYVLYWRWLYENNADEADTTLGKMTESPKYIIEASFGAVQAD